MNKLIFIILIIFVTLISGCSNSNQVIKNENEQLKNKISQIEKDLIDRNIKITELQNKDFTALTINYIQNTNRKRFVEKQCDLSGLPIDNAIRLNTIKENTVANDAVRGRIEEKRDGYVRPSGGNTEWVKETSIIYSEAN